tara:strand:+ start:465 stop:707 length:243 start_codon:yes stop_codon:yes gene_type:complete
MKKENFTPIITNDEKVAKKHNLKQFHIIIWEENKYSKTYYAKSKEDIDECLDDVLDDFECDKFHFRKGNTEITDIIEEEK